MNIESLCVNTHIKTDDIINAVLKNHSDMVYRLALSHLRNKADAEDIFQDVFVKYIKSNKTFESNEHIKAWLIRVTLNCCNKFRKTAWFRHTVPLEDWSNELTDESGHEKSEVYYAIQELPPKYRTVIHLFYYEDMPVAEISSVLNMKQSTVISQLSRARNILKGKLKGDYENE